MKPTHDLRNEVRKHRQAGGLTQQELAEKVGVTRQTVLSIEKGKYTPSVALALNLAAVLGVRVEDLFQRNPGDCDA
jgi:putative transcriptional regulator